MMTDKTRATLMKELEREWFRKMVQVTALFISYERPQVEIEDMPKKIDFTKLQQLTDQLLTN